MLKVTRITKLLKKIKNFLRKYTFVTLNGITWPWRMFILKVWGPLMYYTFNTWYNTFIYKKGFKKGLAIGFMAGWIFAYLLLYVVALIF